MTTTPDRQSQQHTPEGSAPHSQPGRGRGITAQVYLTKAADRLLLVT